MKYTFNHNDKEYSLVLEKTGDDYTACIGDVECTVTEVERDQCFIVFTLKEIRYAVYVNKSGTQYFCNVAGENYIFEKSMAQGVRKTCTGGQQENSVRSPMPGLIVKIPVAINETVEQGATLVIVEAMKMQNELRAPRKGVVKKINFKEGEQVDALQSIVELE